MTNRELRKEAHNRIIKDGNTHQEAFDAMQYDNSISKEELAENLAKIPSKAVIERIKVWKIVYIALMGVIILLRILGIVVLGSVNQIETSLLVILVLAGIVMPAFGIVSTVQNKIDGLKFYSIFFVLGVLRSYKSFQGMDVLTIAVLVPYAAAVILGFWLPYIAKTPYKRVVKDVVQPDGSIRKTAHIVFEDDQIASGENDLLDAGI
ncbi:MAG: hypothetical protein HYZ43_15470 [Flavobacteriia bacterium]|nr:hypothetical protein [Flavobacteriia bacterium]